MVAGQWHTYYRLTARHTAVVVVTFPPVGIVMTVVVVDAQTSCAVTGTRRDGTTGKGVKKYFGVKGIRMKKALLVFCHVCRNQLRDRLGNRPDKRSTGRPLADAHSPRQSSFTRCFTPPRFPDSLARSRPSRPVCRRNDFFLRGNTKPTGPTRFGFALCPSSRKTIETTTVRFDMRSISFYSYAVNGKTIFISIRTVNYHPFILKTVASFGFHDLGK